jgi:hypothetical protein
MTLKRIVGRQRELDAVNHHCTGNPITYALEEYVTADHEQGEQKDSEYNVDPTNKRPGMFSVGR